MNRLSGTVIVIAIFATVALMFIGAMYGGASSGGGRGYRETESAERLKFEGHFYIYFPQSAVHDPDCPCWKRSSQGGR